MDWLAHYSTGIQAISSLVIVLLTSVLVYVTARYVRSTATMVRIMERDSAIRLQPRIVPELHYHWVGDAADGAFVLANPGPNDAVLSRVELSYYCSHSEHTEPAPLNYMRLIHRLIPPGQQVEVTFTVSPANDCLYHEDHEGDCHWIFRVDVTCTDVLRLIVVNYSLDEALGIHHYFEGQGSKASWFRLRTLALMGRLRNYRYRFNRWLRKAWPFTSRAKSK